MSSLYIIQPGKEKVTNTFEGPCIIYQYTLVHIIYIMYIFIMCLQLIDSRDQIWQTVPEELSMEVPNIAQEVVTKTILEKKK